MNEYRVGDQVMFGRPNGEKTLGEVVKVNRKTVKVKTLEGRGSRRDYKAGSVWTVAKSLCKPVKEETPKTKCCPHCGGAL